MVLKYIAACLLLVCAALEIQAIQVLNNTGRSMTISNLVLSSGQEYPVAEDIEPGNVLDFGSWRQLSFIANVGDESKRISLRENENAVVHCNLDGSIYYTPYKISKMFSIADPAC